jgi:hypothetical protein
MCSNNLNLEGAPYCQYELAIELARRNEVKPVVHSPTEGPLRAIYERAGIEVIVGRHPLHEVFELPEYNRAIDDFSGWMNRSGFQLIYGNTLQTFYAIDAATRGGLPSLWNIRESEPWQTYFNYLLSPLIPSSRLFRFAVPGDICFACLMRLLRAAQHHCKFLCDS